MPPAVSTFLGFSSVGDGLSLNLAPFQCLTNSSYYVSFWAHVVIPFALPLAAAVVLALRAACVRYCVSPAVRASIAATQAAIKLDGRQRHTTSADDEAAMIRSRYMGLFKTSTVVLMFLVHTRVSKVAGCGSVVCGSVWQCAVKGHETLTALWCGVCYLLLALHQTMFSIFDVYPQPILGLHLLRQHLDVQAFTPKYGRHTLRACVSVCVCMGSWLTTNGSMVRLLAGTMWPWWRPLS